MKPDKKWKTILYFAWLDIRSGKQGKKSITMLYPRVIAIQRLDELIAQWNAQQPKHWEYQRITKK
jgi:hypothetical protein